MHHFEDDGKIVLSYGSNNITFGIDAVGLYRVFYNYTELSLSDEVGYGYVSEEELDKVLYNGDPVHYTVDRCDVIVGERPTGLGLLATVLLEVGDGEYSVLAQVMDYGENWLELRVFGEDPYDHDTFDLDNGVAAKR